VATLPDTWRRLAVELDDGTTLLLAPDEIYYFQAADHDTVVRTARRASYRSSRRLRDLEARLPSPPFFRCHESDVVNLARVRSLEPRGRDSVLRLDPPVNAVLPLARGRAARLRLLLGID
jgi:DNA-binding LytR/AlgR family response regulator